MGRESADQSLRLLEVLPRLYWHAIAEHVSNHVIETRLSPATEDVSTVIRHLPGKMCLSVSAAASLHLSV